MARVALLHLLRSQTSSTNLLSAYHCSRSWTCGRPINANPKSNSSSLLVAAQNRWASQATTKEEDKKISLGPRSGGQSGQDDNESGIVYYGPFSSTIKIFKRLYLSTSILWAVSLVPVITFTTSPDVNVILEGAAVASSAIFFNTSLTAGFHWLFKPYIHKLRWQPDSDSFEVEMISWLATSIPRTIKFADIRPPETKWPFATFKVNSNFYYVHAEYFHNKELLSRLAPHKVTHESAFKN